MFFEDHLAAVRKNFRVDGNYSGYETFLECFKLESNSHRDSGSAIVSYKKNYEYPYDIDEQGQYLEFIKEKVNSVSFIKNLKFEKAWWVDYPKYSYSGLHAHQPGKQLTVVLFLTTSEIDKENPHEGFLYTINDNEYREFRPISGEFHLFDGSIWHGTYPTLSPRKVFVCDFSYEDNI